MAKELVNIVFSADSAQARALWQEIAQGAENAGKKVQQSAKHYDGLGASLTKVVSGYGIYSLAVSTATKLIEQETAAINRRADAFERVQTGFDKIRAEGGLSASTAAGFRGAVANATQFAAVDTGTAQAVAQQMLEDRFSPEEITGGGLNALLKGIVAVNARGEGGDPKNLAKQFANIMQTLGRSPTTGNIESTVADVHGLMNATGLDMAGAEGLVASMARASKPKAAKALKLVGLTPGQIDPNQRGIGVAGQTLAKAISGLSDSEQLAFLSRLMGDEGATAFIRGRGEFLSGRVTSDAKDVQRDFDIGSQGPMAELRRNRAIREQALARKGELDARYRDASQLLDDKYSQGDLLDRLYGTVRPVTNPWLSVLGGQQWKNYEEYEAYKYRESLKVEITSQNNIRASGKARGTAPLAPLNKR